MSNAAAHTLPVSETARGWRARLRGMFGATAQKGIVALVDQAVVSGASFLTTVAVGRFCGLGELGIYSLGFALLVLAAAIHEALVWTPLAVYSNRLAGADRAKYLGHVGVIQVLTASLAALALLAMAGLLAIGVGPQPLQAVVGALLVAMPLYLLREFVRRVLLARLDVGSVLLLDIAVASLQLGGLATLAFTGNLTAASACLILGLACGAPGAIWLMATARITLQRQGLLGTIRRHWHFSRWLCAGQLTAVTQTYSLHWILALTAGTAATGVYAACASVVQFANPLILGIGSVLVPKAAQALHEGGPAEVRRVVWKTTALLGTAMTALCLFLVVFGADFVRLLYDGADATGRGPIVIALAAGMLATTLGFAANNGLWAIERPDASFVGNLIGLLMTVPTAYLLTFHWGVLGAAVGATIGIVAASAVQCAAFAQLSHETPTTKGAV